jgi:hypothetical protein
MRYGCKALVAVGLIFLVTSPILAQGGQGRGQRGQGMRGGQVFTAYLNAESVQTELKLSADDAKKTVDELGKLEQSLSPQERIDKSIKIVESNLKPDQTKRLKQIVWQKAGISTALNFSEVQAALKLDDKQKEKVKTIQEDTQKKVTELLGGAGGAGGAGARRNRGAGGAGGARGGQAFTQVQEARKKADDDITATLTDDQKKAWKEVVGAEFKGEIPIGGRRGRGNGQ